MSFVEVKCASCGATIECTERCGEYRCTYCGALVINIVDATVREDVEIVTPEEMDAYIARNRKSFVINVGERLEEFDIEAKINNKKIADAEENLKNKHFGHNLNGLPDTPVVLRLKLLHQFKVRNEYELSMVSKSISENENYKKLMVLCDETTRATYKIIEEEIARNIAAEAEIKKVDALVNAGLCEDAFVYATEMLKKHPCRAIAHSRYFYAKYNYLAAKYMPAVNFWDRLIRYKHRDEIRAMYSIMKKCPDFEIFTYRYGKRYEYDYKAYEVKWMGDDSGDYPLYIMYLTLLMIEKDPNPDPEVAQYLKNEAKREKKEKKLAAKAARAAEKAAKKAENAAKKGK